MAGWDNFFVAAGGAAAALAGLLFVSVSINLARILEIPSLPPRAAEALVVLLAVLVLSLLALVPGQPPAVLGGEVCALGALLWIVLTFTLVRGKPRQHALLRVLINQLPPAMFVIAGAMVCSGHPQGVYWLVPATLLAIAAGVIGAWVLLIEILR